MTTDVGVEIGGGLIADPLDPNDQAALQQFLGTLPASALNSNTQVLPRPLNVAPNSGPSTGGQSVTLCGNSGFCSAMTGGSVTIGGLAAAQLGCSTTSSCPGGELTVRTPSHASGAVDVVTTTSAGDVSTLVGAYTFDVIPPPVPAMPGSVWGLGLAGVLGLAGFLIMRRRTNAALA